MRTYGTIEYQPVDRRWLLETEPHVSMRLKRVFAKISKGSMGTHVLSDTAENARDLVWFLERYPLVHGALEAARLLARSTEHIERQSISEALLAGLMPAPEVDLAVPLREYQKTAVALMLTMHGMLLADDVGLGKTASAIGLIADPRARPALVVTLTHLPKQWEAEIHRFAPKLRTHILKKGSPYPLTLGAARGRLGQQSLPGAMPDVIISNYHKLRGWSETLRGIVRTVVFDEVQELRKPDSQKYSSAKHVADGAEYVAGLSATPIYNQGSEMHSVMDVVRPDALGTREEFLREWCRDGANPGQEAIVDPKAFGMHMRELGLMLRRTRSEVGRELPGLTRIPHHVDANLDALDRVSQDCRDLALFIVGKGANPLKAIDDDEDSRGETMRASMELSNKLRQATGIAKAPHVADFVRLLVESGERVVLYGWHRAVYEIWNERLADLKPAMFTGSESTHQKEEAKIRFETGHSKVLILSLRAGAGLDGLQHVCRTVVFGELDWAYGVHEQAEGRVARDGQKDPVMAYYLVSDEGSDPVVSDALNLKGEQLKGIRDPKAELVEQLQTDPYRVRKLAEAYLASRVATIDSMEVA